MLALISGFIGFLSSMAPEVIKLVTEKADRKHELALLEKQAELGLKQAEKEHAKAEVDAGSQAFIEAQKSYRAEIKLAKESFIAAYSATVRPTITYLFFFLYVVIKIKLFLYATETISAPNLPWNVESAVKMIWTENDVMMFSWIIGYWYGNRSLRNKA